MEEGQVLNQDLSKKAPEAGAVCPIHLFFKQKVEMPSKEKIIEIMEKHLGEGECFSYSTEMAAFAPKKYIAEFKDGNAPVQLMITACLESSDYHIDELTRSQMWDCPESEEILSSCPYHVIAVDMLAGALPNYKDRANMLMDFMEALVELYPNCVAVQFQSSGKMFTREKIVNHQVPYDKRFIYFAVNVRFFNIQGTPDSLVDTIGMNILYMPDFQYHFHNMDPNWVVNHAYNSLTYIYDNGVVINDGDTIGGIVNGNLDSSVKWRCQYEDSLIQPIRDVIDVYMNEYASGQR